MLAVNYSTLRGALKEYCDRVSDEAEVLVVTRKGGDNVVMLSEQRYNNMLENAYVRQSAANYEHILTSLKQLSECQTARHELIDPDAPPECAHE